ncbi:phage head-tail joining protein [Cellvibrio mixtus]|uniref:phage head-tail joining protein n=1 Tax=Cellvibrio mixtus TaxID=39650 RepID=UPI0005866958|nr:hypothetical protein [Cellvibrio mixtus]
MAYTQADIDALEVAMISGVKKVKIDGRETEFRDLDEMERLLNTAKASVAGRRRTAYTSSGYDRGYQ